MNNNSTNIDEILNECQQNINNALNLVNGNKTEVRTLPVYDMAEINKVLKSTHKVPKEKIFTLPAEINKVLKSTTQNNPNENKSELDKIYWDNNTHSGDELDIVIERLHTCETVVNKLNDIGTLIKDKFTNEDDYLETEGKIFDCIDNIIEEFTLELYKAGFTKAVKLMTECYNYNNK